MGVIRVAHGMTGKREHQFGSVFADDPDHFQPVFFRIAYRTVRYVQRDPRIQTHDPCGCLQFLLTDVRIAVGTRFSPGQVAHTDPVSLCLECGSRATHEDFDIIGMGPECQYVKFH